MTKSPWFAPACDPAPVAPSRPAQLLKGRLLFGRPVIRVDCLVRKLTAVGAEVVLISGLHLPRRVFLFLDGSDELHEARLMQSQGWVSQLKFVPPAPQGLEPSAGRSILAR